MDIVLADNSVFLDPNNLEAAEIVVQEAVAEAAGEDVQPSNVQVSFQTRSCGDARRLQAGALLAAVFVIVLPSAELPVMQRVSQRIEQTSPEAATVIFNNALQKQEPFTAVQAEVRTFMAAVATRPTTTTTAPVETARIAAIIVAAISVCWICSLLMCWQIRRKLANRSKETARPPPEIEINFEESGEDELNLEKWPAKEDPTFEVDDLPIMKEMERVEDVDGDVMTEEKPSVPSRPVELEAHELRRMRVLRRGAAGGGAGSRQSTASEVEEGWDLFPVHCCR